MKESVICESVPWGNGWVNTNADDTKPEYMLDTIKHNKAMVIFNQLILEINEHHFNVLIFEDQLRHQAVQKYCWTINKPHHSCMTRTKLPSLSWEHNRVEILICASRGELCRGNIPAHVIVLTILYDVVRKWERMSHCVSWSKQKLSASQFSETMKDLPAATDKAAGCRPGHCEGMLETYSLNQISQRNLRSFTKSKPGSF